MLAPIQGVCDMECDFCGKTVESFAQHIKSSDECRDGFRDSVFGDSVDSGERTKSELSEYGGDYR